ncbi:glycosyltransferase [Streptomyces aureoverticillatus]|uniref:glycosyltransferase n=1 Tax=Streptomyces aureoverticillatus TaxID=66871 RepID=UPI0013DA33E8|nr:glycosyltransferase [Streptomyces aureoverticillatus]QIB42815.1 glycosyltransferase family 4 protein [Streptomyces aureoverticillatus]
MPTALFAWRRTPPPLLIGGAEVTQQLLAEELAAAGWRVIYLGSHEAPWDQSSQLPQLHAFLDTHRTPYEETNEELRYRWNGVHCIAVPQRRTPAALSSLLSQVRPDVVFTSQEGAADLAAQARPAALVAGILHSVSETGLGVLGGRPHLALAVSKFVDRRAPRTEGTRLAVLYPPFTSPRPSGHVRRTGSVLMVNPIPAKGSDLLHQLIRRIPEQHFTLVEGWWNTAGQFAAYANVTFVPRVYDMSPLYWSHRLLLVPSVVEDAFPRVIIEAALHGTPSIGTDRGGIPEAIGTAGIVLPRTAGPQAWVEAIRTVDHHTMGKLAQQHAARFTRPRLPDLTSLGIYPAANASST